MRLHRFLLPAIAVASFVIPTTSGSIANADVIIDFTNDGATGAILDANGGANISLADGIAAFLIPEAQADFPGLTLAVDGTTTAGGGTFNGTGGTFGINSDGGGDDSQRLDGDLEETLILTFNQDVLLISIDFSSFGADSNVLLNGDFLLTEGNVVTFDTPFLVTAGEGFSIQAVSVDGTTGSDVGIEDITIAAVTQDLPDFETIALAGDQAPDADVGVVLNSFSAPSVNASGQTVFNGFLVGAGVDLNNSSGVYRDDFGMLEQVARRSDQAPGAAGGVVFTGFDFSAPVLNDSGQTAFLAFLGGTGVNETNDSGIYSDGSGALAQVARTGDQAPGSGAAFSDFDSPVLNASGQTAFRAELTGGTNQSGIYSEGSGTLAQVARTGEQAPGAGNGVFFDDFGDPVLNVLGQTVFLADLSGTGVDGTNDMGIYSEASGALAQLARTGDQAPDADSGVVFDRFRDPVINASGQIVLRAELSGTGVDSTNGEAVYATLSGTLAEVVRTGDQVPGASGGVAFGGFNFFSNPLLNNSGQIAFEGFLVGDDVTVDDNTALYVTDQSGQLEQVVRAGDQAPGTASGIVFDSFSEVALNDSGQLAFRANLFGEGVDEEFNDNDTAIFATNVDGEVVLIAREGEMFDVDDDPMVEDLRRVTFLTFVDDTGNGDGRSSGFNDLGQIAFRLNFDGGTSGVFVSNLVATVPEPILGDVNRDGTVDFLDIAPFITLLTDGEFQAEADIDQNGEVNFEDILPFIGILSDS